MARRGNEMVEQTAAARRLGSSATTRNSSEKELMRIFQHRRGAAESSPVIDGRSFFLQQLPTAE
jgi:hypothetical protein